MATKCIDISDNKRLGTTSPIAMFAFVAIFIAITALVEVGFLYIILIIVAFVFTQIFFQYKPRFVYLTIRYLGKNAYLTPSCEDKHFLVDDLEIPAVVDSLSEYEISKIRKERQAYDQKLKKTHR